MRTHATLGILRCWLAGLAGRSREISDPTRAPVSRWRLPRLAQQGRRGVFEVLCYVKLRGVQLGDSFWDLPRSNQIAVQLKECTVKMFAAWNVRQRCDLLNAKPIPTVHRRRTNDSKRNRRSSRYALDIRVMNFIPR